jgi:hypothetical protein
MRAEKNGASKLENGGDDERLFDGDGLRADRRAKRICDIVGTCADVLPMQTFSAPSAVSIISHIRALNWVLYLIMHAGMEIVHGVCSY